METDTPTPLRRFLAMASLVLAGETIFVPAFYLGRYFRSSMMETLGVDDRQLGEAYALYGVVAMASYLIGGPIADRFSPRKLIVISLLASGSGCLYLATFPGLTGLRALYAFWGASTILLFWAPLLRATREWGGATAQGRAYGLLDGGRGLTAALIASAATLFFSMRHGEADPDPARLAATLSTILYFFAACSGGAAVCVWLFLPHARPVHNSAEPRGGTLERFAAVARMPAIWLQAIVVVSAYFAFKAIDYYGQYCEDITGLSEAGSARVVAMLSYLRVVSAISAGWLADRLSNVAGVILVCFGSLVAVYVCFLLAPMGPGLIGLVIANMAVSCVAFFGLRGVYFALFEEEGIPRHSTGAAVGLISFIGFTPEIFMPWIAGVLIDTARDQGDVAAGYERLFFFLLVTTLAGAVSAATLWRRKKRGGDP